MKAGLVSSPAIIIIALSGISAYTVPDLTGTLSLVRMGYIVAAGSIGTYGIILLTGFLLYYLLCADEWGVPLLAPFSPLIPHDLRDSLYKADIWALSERAERISPEKPHTSAEKGDKMKLCVRQICFLFAAVLPVTRLLVYPATLSFWAKTTCCLRRG